MTKTSHFFEGPEKKLEILLNSQSDSLLERPKEFWVELVSHAQAQILSEIGNVQTKAFLLSESSLFVWKHRLILITCGTTTLIKAARFILDHLGKDQIDEIFYERKNEYQPSLQKSTALEDMQALTSSLGGAAKRYGRLDDHHVYVYNKLLNAQSQNPKVKTLELLMYGLQGDFKNLCVNQEEQKEKLKQELKKILPDFAFDTFFFDPEGFSFNALSGSSYATMHVTPQGEESYLSFEIDQGDLKKNQMVVKRLLDFCKPTSFDLILFSDLENETVEVPQDYQLKQESKDQTESGYQVYYQHYYDTGALEQPPFWVS